MNLTPEEAAIAEARGCRLVPADAQQVAVLSMQRRVFWVRGEPWLILRPDGFVETAATLRHLLEQPGAPAVPAPEAVVDTSPAASVMPPAEQPPLPVAASADPAAEQAPKELPEGTPEEIPAESGGGDATEGLEGMPTLAAGPRKAPAALVMTANLVARYVAATPVDAKDLPELIRGIHRSVCALQPVKEGA